MFEESVLIIGNTDLTAQHTSHNFKVPFETIAPCCRVRYD